MAYKNVVPVAVILVRDSNFIQDATVFSLVLSACNGENTQMNTLFQCHKIHIQLQELYYAVSFESISLLE